MSAGTHDLGGAFNENAVHLVIDDPNACLVLLCSLAGMWSQFSRDFGSDGDFFLILCFSNKSIMTILRSKYMKHKW